MLMTETNSTLGECFMVHPDYIIGAVLLLVIFALLPIRIRYERAEYEAERKAEKPQPKMIPEKLDEFAGVLAAQWTDEFLHEAGHLLDDRPYPLQPSRHIKAPIRHDAPYQITKVILPMESDHQKWN